LWRLFVKGVEMENVADTGYGPLWQKFIDRSNTVLGVLLVGVPTLALAGLFLLRRSAMAMKETALETRRAAQANLLAQLHAEYGSAEITAAMRNLHRWREDHPTDFAEKFVELYKQRDPLADALDSDRRRVYRFFAKVHLLIDYQLIDAALADVVAFAPVGGQFLLDVLEPIQEAHGKSITHTGYDKPLFDKYRC